MMEGIHTASMYIRLKWWNSGKVCLPWLKWEDSRGVRRDGMARWLDGLEVRQLGVMVKNPARQ